LRKFITFYVEKLCVETYIFGVNQIHLTYCSTVARETLWFEPLYPRRRPSR